METELWERRIRRSKISATLQCLGICSMWSDQTSEASRWFALVRDRANAAMPPNRARALGAIYGLAYVKYLNELNSPELTRLTRENLQYARDALGPDHPTTLKMATMAVNCSRLAGLYHEAYELARDSAERCLRVFGPKNTDFLLLQGQLSEMENVRGLNAVESLRKVVVSAERNFGTNFIYTLYLKGRLAKYLGWHRKFEESERILEGTLARIAKVEGPYSLEARRILPGLAEDYIAQGRYDEALETREQFLEAIKVVQVNAPNYLNQITGGTDQLAILHARRAEWTEVAALYEQVGTSVTNHLDYFAGGILACHLAGKSETAVRLARQALNLLNRSDLKPSSFHLALVFVALLDRLPDRDATLETVARYCERRDADSKRTLVDGMRALRTDSRAEAMKLLDQIHDPSTRAVAELASALIAHRQGDPANAKRRYDRADRHVKAVASRGDLGDSTRPIGREWILNAVSMAMREEAALAVTGHSAEPALDAEYLRDRRNEWKEVHSRLEEANQLAGARNWTDAARIYLQVIENPDIPWNGAAKFYEDLLAKLVCAVHQAGIVPPRDHRLVQWIEEHSNLFWRDPSLLNALLLTGKVGTNTWAAMLDRAVDREESSRWKQESQPIEFARHVLDLGIASLRNRLDNDALEAFRQVWDCFDLHVSGLAHAMAAVAYHRLNDEANRREHLGVAESIHRQLIESWGDDWGNNWHRLVLLELAVNEARATSDHGSDTPRAR